MWADFEELASTWGLHVFYLLVQADVLALAAVAFAVAARRLPSRVRYAVLFVALVKFALPPMLPLPTGVFSAGPQVAGPFFREAELALVTARPGGIGALTALFVVHVAGIAIGCARLVRGALALRALRSRASSPEDAALVAEFAALCDRMRLRTRPRLLVSDEIAAPMAFGSLRPCVVVPARLVRDLSLESVRLVLAHELAHVRRGDLRANALQAAVRAFWWFDPCLAALSRALDRAREECCDDEVIALFAGCEREYSAALVDAVEAAALAREARLRAALGVSSGRGGELAARLRRLAAAGYRPSRRAAPLEIAAVAAAALLLLPGLTPAPGSQPAAATDRLLSHFGLAAPHDHSSRHAHGRP